MSDPGVTAVWLEQARRGRSNGIERSRIVVAVRRARGARRRARGAARRCTSACRTGPHRLGARARSSATSACASTARWSRRSRRSGYAGDERQAGRRARGRLAPLVLRAVREQAGVLPGDLRPDRRREMRRVSAAYRRQRRAARGAPARGLRAARARRRERTARRRPRARRGADGRRRRDAAPAARDRRRASRCCARLPRRTSRRRCRGRSSARSPAALHGGDRARPARRPRAIDGAAAGRGDAATGRCCSDAGGARRLAERLAAALRQRACASSRARERARARRRRRRAATSASGCCRAALRLVALEGYASCARRGSPMQAGVSSDSFFELFADGERVLPRGARDARRGAARARRPTPRARSATGRARCGVALARLLGHLAEQPAVRADDRPGGVLRRARRRSSATSRSLDAIAARLTAGAPAPARRASPSRRSPARSAHTIRCQVAGGRIQLLPGARRPSRLRRAGAVHRRRRGRSRRSPRSLRA